MAAPYLSRLGEMAFKVETTAGTKNLPAVDGTESKVRVFDLSWTDDPRTFDRRHYSKSLSRYPHLVGQNLAQVTGRIELRKTAVTATEDFWGPLLKACGFAFNSGTGAYTLTTDLSAIPTLTVLCWKGSDGSSNAIRSGMRGAAGSCRIEGRVGEPLMLSFTLYGVHDPSDSDLITKTDGLNTITHETAIPGTFQNASTVTWGGTAIRLGSFAIDFGQTVVERQNVASSSGVEHFVVTDRNVVVTLDPEVPITSSINWRNLAHVGTEAAIALTHVQPATSSPSLASRSFAFSIPKAQITAISEGDRNGIATFGVTAAANLSSEPGDDEFSLTITGS